MDIMLERILMLVGNKHGASKALADYLGTPSNLVTEWKKGREQVLHKIRATNR